MYDLIKFYYVRNLCYIFATAVQLLKTHYKICGGVVHSLVLHSPAGPLESFLCYDGEDFLGYSSYVIEQRKAPQVQMRGLCLLMD